MQLRFVVDGEVQLSRVLMGIEAAVRNLTPAFEKSAEDLLRIIQYDVFETEGGAIEAEWAPLSPGYARWKEKHYPGQGLLVATGTMQQSFTSVVDPTSLIIGNSMEYFKYHQSRQPRTKMPRRIMLRLTENMREMVVKNVQEQIVEQASV